MTILYYADSSNKITQVKLSKGESVLNGLLRYGIDVPYGCRNGVCQSCLMKSTIGDEVPFDAQKGLRSAQKDQGYFLSCCCQPERSMTVSISDLYKKEESVVLEKAQLSPTVVRLRLSKAICYRPGQFATLWKDDTIARTYSIASNSSHDDFLEFHVRVYPDGVFSNWVADEVKEGDVIQVQGAMGDCFYTSDCKDHPLFLSGLGTGLAPLYGIVRDALLQGHKQDIVMLLGAKTKDSLYYQAEIGKLSNDYPQLRVYYSVAELQEDDHVYAKAQSLIPDFTGYRVFLSGGDSFVQKMRKQCFLAGANMTDISADIFLMMQQ